MSAERALLRRLVEWLDGTEGKVAWTGEQTLRDFVLPVTGIAEDARALLAEPAPECDDDIHDELCDCNQARPHLFRAEAEAMVEAYDDALSRWDYWNGHEYRDYYKVRVDEAEAELTTARTALLTALTGEEK